MDRSREHDLEAMRKDWKGADRHTRQLIERAADRIRHEDRTIGSMREALIKEHRKMNKENIEDIHTYIQGKDRYKNE